MQFTDPQASMPGDEGGDRRGFWFEAIPTASARNSPPLAPPSQGGGACLRPEHPLAPPLRRVGWGGLHWPLFSTVRRRSGGSHLVNFSFPRLRSLPARSGSTPARRRQHARRSSSRRPAPVPEPCRPACPSPTPPATDPRPRRRRCGPSRSGSPAPALCRPRHRRRRHPGQDLGNAPVQGRSRWASSWFHGDEERLDFGGDIGVGGRV